MKFEDLRINAVYKDHIGDLYEVTKITSDSFWLKWVQLSGEDTGSTESFRFDRTGFSNTFGSDKFQRFTKEANIKRLLNKIDNG